MNRHTPAGRGANLYLAEVEVTGVDGSMVRSLFETLGSEAVMPANVPDHILCESGPASASAKTAVDRGRTDNVLQDQVAAL